MEHGTEGKGMRHLLVWRWGWRLAAAGGSCSCGACFQAPAPSALRAGEVKVDKARSKVELSMILKW